MTITPQEGKAMRFLRFDTGVERQHGFTLIELMVTLTVAGILLSLGIPAFSKLIANNRIATQTNEFVGALNVTRSEAVRRSQGVSIRSKDGGIEFATGWTVFNDPNLTGNAPASSEVLRKSSGLAGKTTLRRVTRSGTSPSFTYADASSGTSYLVFNSRGGNDAGASAFFRVCDSGDSTIKGRIVQVSAIGKVSLDSSTASCP
jgi:type IV fimbrial biogenesis protein FimT